MTVLLAWYFGKRPKARLVSIGAPSKGRPMRLDDTSLRSIFIELANATQLGYFVITRGDAPARSGLNHVLDIGYRDGLKFHVWAEQQSEANSTSRQECIDFLLCRYPQEIEVKDDEIRSSDPTCKLFTKVRATLASSFAHINDKKKGNTLYHPNGVVGVITGHGNTKVALRYNVVDGTISYRDLTLDEAARAKGLSEQTTSYILRLEERKAGSGWSALASCIPPPLLEAVYRALLKHANRSSPLPSFVEAAELNAKIAADEIKIALGSSNDAPVLTPIDYDASDKISKYPGTPPVSKAGWPRMSKPGSLEDAKTRIKVQRYYNILLRSGDTLERDILASTRLVRALGLRPGDSRYLSYTEEHNPSTRNSNQSFTGWHPIELNHGPGEAWMIDVWYSPVVSAEGRCRYILFAVDVDSDTIIDIPLTDLGIDSIAQAFSKLVSTVRLQYKRKVELILCDCFKTFLEERVMKRLKDKLGLEIRSFPPHLHWWNKAEGVIRIIREAAVKRLQRLKPFATKHGLVIEEYYVHAIRHAVISRNQSSSSALQRKFNSICTPIDRISGGTYHHSEILPFASYLTYHVPKGGLANLQQNHHRHKLLTAGEPALYMSPADYHFSRSLVGDSKSSVVLVLRSKKTTISADFKESSMSPQALRFAQGRILGETNTSWYVGEVTLENERRIMECISKLDTDEIKSPYREDIRPDDEEFVRSVKISHRRRPDGKYTELIRLIHEVLGASVENYKPNMYDSITLNDTQVCKRHRDLGNRGTSLCMAFSDENGYAGGNLVIHEPTGPVKRDTRRKILQYDGSVEHEVEEIIGVDGKPPRRIAFILYNSRVHVPPVHSEEIHPTPGVQDMFQPVPMIMGRMSQVHQGPRPGTETPSVMAPSTAVPNKLTPANSSVYSTGPGQSMESQPLSELTYSPDMHEPSDVQESGRPVRDRKPPDAYDPGSIAQPDGKWREGPSSTVTGSPGTVSQRLPETSRFEEEQNTGTIGGPPTRSDASPDATNPTPSGGIDISSGDTTVTHPTSAPPSSFAFEDLPGMGPHTETRNVGRRKLRFSDASVDTPAAPVWASRVPSDIPYRRPTDRQYVRFCNDDGTISDGWTVTRRFAPKEDVLDSRGNRISKKEQVCVEGMYLDENGIEQSTGDFKSIAVGRDRFGTHWEFSEPLSVSKNSALSDYHQKRWVVLWLPFLQIIEAIRYM